ncbi:MAG: hypothetical protein KKF26_05470, partial [Chloroflexi bacterium]|nr:hypothetical protein [Chloroflexota bacterium]
ITPGLLAMTFLNNHELAEPEKGFCSILVVQTLLTLLTTYPYNVVEKQDIGGKRIWDYFIKYLSYLLH